MLSRNAYGHSDFIFYHYLNLNLFPQVISHKSYNSRVEFDKAVSDALEEEGVQLVCLAGFMRILSGEFVRRWHGRLLNVHPSLLPSFKGMNAHKQVLESGARISGCTVHFVEVCHLRNLHTTFSYRKTFTKKLRIKSLLVDFPD